MNGNKENWIPTNQFKVHPHYMERRLFLQQQIVNKVSGQDLAKLVMNNWKEVGSKDSEKGSFFDNIKQLDEISIGYGSELGSVLR